VFYHGIMDMKRRCMYCVSQGDTLASVMEALVGDSNWLRLWAANGNEDGLNETVTIYHPVTRQNLAARSLMLVLRFPRDSYYHGHHIPAGGVKGRGCRAVDAVWVLDTGLCCRVIRCCLAVHSVGHSDRFLRWIAIMLRTLR
jgi:hypothetical protein